jgi:AcrR family transcriptional regulator
VARRAGVSPTAVYRHFDDHLDLLGQAVEYCWTNFRDAMQDGKDSSGDLYVAFHNTGLHYIDFAVQHRGQYRELFSNRLDLDLAPVASAAETFEVAIQMHTWIHGIVDLVGGNPGMPWPDPLSMLDGLGEALRLVQAEA